MQLVAPAAEYVPAGHVVQLDAPAAEYVPARHFVQLVAPAAEYVPAKQLTHEEPLRYVPAVHVGVVDSQQQPSDVTLVVYPSLQVTL